MNANRRKRLNEVAVKLRELTEVVNDIGGEEQEAFDNMPEQLQESEKGERMEDIIDQLEDMSDSLEDVVSSIEDIIIS